VDVLVSIVVTDVVVVDVTVAVVIVVTVVTPIKDTLSHVPLVRVLVVV